jgi:hypothetical protein
MGAHGMEYRAKRDAALAGAPGRDSRASRIFEAAGKLKPVSLARVFDAIRSYVTKRFTRSDSYFDPVRCVVLLTGQMRRRQFITLGSSAALVWPLTAASAQQAKKIPRLCFLTFDPGTLESTRFKPFFQALRELGYVDGQTITIDYLSANGQGERFADLAADCQRLKADAIFTNWSFP